MRNSILNTAEDLQWLRDVHLKGVPLMSEFSDFRFAILQGNEDAPYAVNLYLSDNPEFTDDYLRVTFDRASPIYCEMEPFCGKTDKPRGFRFVKEGA